MAIEEKNASYGGRVIYNEKIREKMEPEDEGKLVVIDIHSGDYEIDRDDSAAMFRLLARRPDAYFWLERVGYSAPYVKGLRIDRSDAVSNFPHG